MVKLRIIRTYLIYFVTHSYPRTLKQNMKTNSFCYTINNKKQTCEKRNHFFFSFIIKIDNRPGLLIQINSLFKKFSNQTHKSHVSFLCKNKVIIRLMFFSCIIIKNFFLLDFIFHRTITPSREREQNFM